MSFLEEQGKEPPTQSIVISSITEGLIDRIRNGDREGVEELGRILQPGIRLLMEYHLEHEATDAQIRNAISVFVQAIQCHDLRDPEAVGTFVRPVVLRQIEALQRAGREQDEHRVDAGNDSQGVAAETMAKALSGFSLQESEALTRFYVHGQSEQQICFDMQILPEDFLALKSRAKARFAELESAELGQYSDEHSERREGLTA